VEAALVAQGVAGRISPEAMTEGLTAVARKLTAARVAEREAVAAASRDRPVTAVDPDELERAVEALRLRMASAAPAERRTQARLMCAGVTFDGKGLRLGVRLPVPAPAWSRLSRSTGATLRIYLPPRAA